MTTSIAIIEDNLNFLEKFVNIIAGMPDFRLAGVASSGKTGLALINEHPANIYLIDLGLPDMSGTEVIAHAMANDPTCCVMVVTVFADEASILSSIDAGATGYLLKDSGPEEVMDCIRNLRDGGAAVSPMVARTTLNRLRQNQENAAVNPVSNPEAPAAAEGPALSHFQSLTTREMEILRLLSTGLSFNEMGTRIFISPHTVAKHVKNIYRKLFVKSRGEAVYAAHKHGLLN